MSKPDAMPLLFRGLPRISLDGPAPYPKAPPKLWPLFSDGSHRSYIIWWGIFLMARSRARRQLATNGAPQNAAVRCQNSFYSIT